MSGVNCTRRKSTPIARAYALASSVLATPGTPSSSTWPPTVVAASSTSTTWSWPTTTLRDLARRPGRVARSRRPPVAAVDARRARARARARPRRSSPAPSSAAISASSQPSAACRARDLVVGRRRAAAPARVAMRSRAHCCTRRERAGGVARALQRDRQRAHVLGARAAGGRVLAGRADRSGARATRRTRARRREDDERDLPPRRDRARSRGCAVAVHAFGEHDGPAGVRRRARGRTRRCRPRRGTRSRAATGRRGSRISPRPTRSRVSSDCVVVADERRAPLPGVDPRAVGRGRRLVARRRATRCDLGPRRRARPDSTAAAGRGGCAR